MEIASILVSPTPMLKGWLPEYTILPSGALRLRLRAPDDTFILPEFVMVKGRVLVPVFRAAGRFGETDIWLSASSKLALALPPYIDAPDDTDTLTQ